MMATTMMTMTTMVHSARAASLWRGAWAGLIAASGARKIAQPLFLFLFLFLFFFFSFEASASIVLSCALLSSLLMKHLAQYWLAVHCVSLVSVVSLFSCPCDYAISPLHNKEEERDCQLFVDFRWK